MPKSYTNIFEQIIFQHISNKVKISLIRIKVRIDKIVEVNKHSVLALDSESNNHISYVTHIQTKSIHMK